MGTCVCSLHMYMSLLFQRVTEKCDELSKELKIQTALCEVVPYVHTIVRILICICSVKSFGLIFQYFTSCYD